ncbi:MAG TPA: cupin domain-containing protein [Thermomicrobiales bacterium]|nr:cupin domain-containing protein [Thermomicrobiales bacterium]
MATTDRRFTHVPAGGGPAYSIIGEVITFKVTGAETGDTFSVMALTSPPGGGPPLHTHAAAETFTVVEGELEFSGLDDGEPYAIRATPGDTVYIPGGAPHTYRNAGATPARALAVLAPGGAMERFFAEAGTPVSDRAAPAAPAGPPSEAEVARHMAIAGRHGIVFLPPREAAAGAGGAAGVRHG